MTTDTLKTSACLFCPACGDLENEGIDNSSSILGCFFILPFFFFFNVVFDSEQDIELKYQIGEKL